MRATCTRRTFETIARRPRRGNGNSRARRQNAFWKNSKKKTSVNRPIDAVAHESRVNYASAARRSNENAEFPLGPLGVSIIIIRRVPPIQLRTKKTTGQKRTVHSGTGVVVVINTVRRSRRGPTDFPTRYETNSANRGRQTAVTRGNNENY